jgi:hypothetical protein
MTVIFDLSNKPADSEVKAKEIELAHPIKRGRGSFGYHLITTIATHTDQILKHNETFTPDDIELLVRAFVMLVNWALSNDCPDRLSEIKLTCSTEA